MRVLILSDIHSNLYAFQAVLHDAGTWDQVVFLGDVANFGPHPAECIELLRSLNPVAVIGNHDVYIAQSWSKKDVNAFDCWSKNQISNEQKKWLRSIPENVIISCDEKRILITHGAFDADYDILPGIPNEMIMNAFSSQITEPVDEVWFGHYHYQIDRDINGIAYHCIRPVGHHRDYDTRAGYSIYENGIMTHHRVEYNVEQTVKDTLEKMTFWGEPLKSQWIELLREGFQENLLKKDTATMKSYQA